MTGSTLGIIIIAIVTVIILAAWIALVFYADNPFRLAASGAIRAEHGRTGGQRARSTAPADYGLRAPPGGGITGGHTGCGSLRQAGCRDGSTEGQGRVIPDGSTGRPSLCHRVSGIPGAAAKRRGPRMAAAYAAAALAFTYAAVSLYWAAGGTTLLSTVGGSIEDIGRDGGLPAVALGLAAAALKLAGGVLALALVRPWGRVMPRAWLLACAVGASVVLACYGAIQVAAGSLVLSGAMRPAAVVDWTALRWHVLVWDMWFLIWGILLAAATVTWWRHCSVRTGRTPDPAERARRPCGGPGGDTPEHAGRVSTRAPR